MLWSADEFFFTNESQTVTAIVEDSNYTVNGATINHSYEIKWYDGAPDATVSGTMGENGWYLSNVTVSAPEGYTISKTADGGYSQSITFENGESAVYYLMQAETRYVAKVDMGEIKTDFTHPTAEIAIGEYKWTSSETELPPIVRTAPKHPYGRNI